MIKKAIKAIKNIFVPPIKYRNFEDDIECAIDEDVVECKEMDEEPPYTGVPASVLNPVDEWFSSSYGCPSAITEKQKDYMEQETEIKMQEEKRREEAGEEPENIHQLMYEMATKNWISAELRRMLYPDHHLNVRNQLYLHQWHTQYL